MSNEFNKKAASYINMLLQFNTEKNDYTIQVDALEANMLERIGEITLSTPTNQFIIPCLHSMRTSASFMLRQRSAWHILTLEEAQRLAKGEM